MNETIKFFGIGFGRTATKSLATAMAILGFESKHGPKSLDEIEKYEFSNDISVTWRYKLLDYVFPNAKFILTIRDIDAWIDSSKQHARHRNRAPLRRLENRFWLYGICHFDEEIFRTAFIAHQNAVIEHFESRLNKLLIMDICNGDGWEKLCAFTDKPIPAVAFPHKHASRAATSLSPDGM